MAEMKQISGGIVKVNDWSDMPRYAREMLLWSRTKECRDRNYLFSYVADKISEKFKDNKPLLNILDVCGSSGYFFYWLDERMHNRFVYRVVDVTPAFLELGKREFEKTSNIFFEYADIHRLVYPEAVFDVVVCLTAMRHLPDIVRPISELLRVSKKYVFFTVLISDTKLKEHVSEPTQKNETALFSFNTYTKEDVLKNIPKNYSVSLTEISKEEKFSLYLIEVIKK